MAAEGAGSGKGTGLAPIWSEGQIAGNPLLQSAQAAKQAFLANRLRSGSSWNPSNPFTEQRAASAQRVAAQPVAAPVQAPAPAAPVSSYWDQPSQWYMMQGLG